MPDIEDVIILCGGAGLRLRAVTGGVPKSLVTVSGRPFLELLLNQLQRYGFCRAILATGHQGAEIRSYFGATFGRLDLAYSNEPLPLGTGGALQYAAGQVRSANCVVMNGDSYTDVDLGKFVACHSKSDADVSLVAVAADERGDCGSILTDSAGNVLQFLEKQGQGSGRYLNAGIYGLSRQMLLDIRPGVQISLERELFPLWIRAGLAVRAFFHSGHCVDIGTPDRYQIAQSLLANAEIETNSVSGAL